MQYSIEPRTRKYVTGYGFLSFTRKRRKQFLHKRLDASKKSSPWSRWIGNEIAGAVLSKALATQTKSKDDNIGKQKPVEEIIVPLEKREEILNNWKKYYKNETL